MLFITSPTMFKRIIIPELGYSRDKYWRRPYEDFLTKISEKAISKNINNGIVFKKNYLSRSSFSKANECELGSDMLDNYFSRNGYMVLYPEKMKLAELICDFYNAEAIATTCGTISHNLLFAPPNSSVIILEKILVLMSIRQISIY